MNAFIGAIWNTIYLIAGLTFWGAVGIYNRIRPRAPIYLAALTVVTIGSFLVVLVLSLVEMVTDWSLFGYLAAFIAVTMTLALGLLWSPLTILVGMIIQPTPNPIESGQRYMRRLGIVLFAELMLADAAYFIPTHQNIVAIPALVIAVATFGLGANLWGGGISPRVLVRLALISVIAVTISFFMPEVPPAFGNMVRGVSRTAADVMNGNVQVPTVQTATGVPAQQQYSLSVALTGRDQWTSPVYPDIRPGWYYQLSGPSGARVLLTDKTVWSLGDCLGVRSIRGARFSGPAGETATVSYSPTPFSQTCP